jgi:hypothetical protein
VKVDATIYFFGALQGQLVEGALMTATSAVKIAGIGLTFLGLSFALLNNLGLFKHRDRLAMVKTIEAFGYIDSTDDGFDDLLRRFPPKPAVPTERVKALGQAGVIAQAANQASNPVGLHYFGPGKSALTTDKRPDVYFSDLKAWASESAFPWLTWMVTLAGASLTVVGQFMGRRRDTVA